MQSKIELYQAVKRKYETALLSISGVVSVGVSANGIVVTVKDPETAKKIPKTIEGAPIIIRVGTYRALQNTHTGRVRPVPGGVSIGAVTVSAGTFSCTVRSTLTGEILGLSNAHVLGAPCYGFYSEGKGTPIIQPAPMDGGTDDDRVGTLHSWVPIEPYKPVKVDAALFKPTRPEILSDRLLDLDLRPVQPVEPHLGMQVRKVGRTTGISFGTITEVDVSVSVESDEYILYDCFIVHPPQTQKFHIWFNITDERDRIIVPACTYVPAFSLPGDSGSLTLLADDVRPVGLVFAGGYDPNTKSMITVCCKASNIQKNLKVSFLSPIPVLPQLANFLSAFSLAFGLTSYLGK